MTDTIHGAFVTAYADMMNPKKNASNPAFRSKYANLEELLNVTRPLLAANGLALVQEPVSEDGCIGVATRLIHTSGEGIDFGAYTVPLAKHDAQGAGSAITYCRRYAIAAIFGLAQEDDDGNAAVAKPKPQSQPGAEPKAGRASQPMLHAIAGSMQTLGFKASDIAIITTELFGKAIPGKELTDVQAKKLAAHLADLVNAASPTVEQVIADLGAEVME